MINVKAGVLMVYVQIVMMVTFYQDLNVYLNQYNYKINRVNLSYKTIITKLQIVLSFQQTENLVKDVHTDM